MFVFLSLFIWWIMFIDLHMLNHLCISGTIRQMKEIKKIQIRKNDVQVPLFAENVILYIKDPNDFTRNPLQLVNTFSEITV